MGSSTAAAPQGRFLLHAATAAGAPPAGCDAAGGAAAGCPPPPPGLQDVQEALAALVSLPTAQQQQQQQSQQPEGPPPLPGPAVGNSAEADSRPRVLLLASWVQSAAAVAEVSMHIRHLARCRSVAATTLAWPHPSRLQTSITQHAAMCSSEYHCCSSTSALASCRKMGKVAASSLTSCHVTLQGLLPPNAVCSAPPDGGLDFRAALAAATAAFAKLFPEAATAHGGQLFGAGQASGGTGTGGGGGGPDAAAAFDDQGAGDDDSDDDTLASLQAALAGIGGNTGTLANGVPGTGHD